jgi:Protein of unknown function (DUF3309)
MALSDAVVILLILTLIALFPAWPYNRTWSYYPSAAVSVVLITLLIYLVAQTV